MKLLCILIRIVALVLCITSMPTVYGANHMNRNIAEELNKVNSKILEFKNEPLQDSNNANLRGAFFILNGIILNKDNLTPNEFKTYRLEILKLHIEIVYLFEKYYIENYKPQKPYYLHLPPPEGAMDATGFGQVDPDEIKDKNILQKYKSDLNENNKIGSEMSFQGEMNSLKHALEAPDIDSGSTATVELFIRNNYAFTENDKKEIEDVINIYNINQKSKYKILKTMNN